MRSNVDFGIDLGTTNSSIAVWGSPDVTVFRNLQRSETTPSAVYIDPRGNLYVGRRAYDRLAADPENTAAAFKRRMGSREEKLFSAAGVRMSPEQLSAEVLNSLCADVTRVTGETVDQAVITVPADFSQPQCDATAEAARLAGIETAHLLQEPIAAAIAYGHERGSADGCWMVYDLGGGTFDCAVVAIRDNRLSVLEHRGNNFLGGRDFDDLMIDHMVIPALKLEFDLPDRLRNDPEYRRLMQRLRLEVEKTRIELSGVEQAQLSIFDAGVDQRGRSIELDVEVSRDKLDELIRGRLMETVQLCREALTGSGVAPAGVESVLLVGGPTLTPGLRGVLGEELGIPLDTSLDPMTVVARGAAVYASGVRRGAVLAQSTPGQVQIDLRYEPLWSETECAVAGRLVGDGSANGYRGYVCQIDEKGGSWSSGRIPVKDGAFICMVRLVEHQESQFVIGLFDASNRPVQASPSDFSIRHGLTPNAPPLPHSISVEVRDPVTGKPELDKVFPRGTPLPARDSRTFKAMRTFTPEVPGESLYVKIWEGESVDDPQANQFVGAVQLPSSSLNRALPEGSDVEVELEVDTSRRVTARVSVPYLALSWENRFDGRPARLDPAAQAQALNESLRANREELAEVRQAISGDPGRDGLTLVGELSAQLQEAERGLTASAEVDSDGIGRIARLVRDVRGGIASLKKKYADALARAEYQRELGWTERAVQEFGDDADQTAFDAHHRDAERALRTNDAPLLRLSIEGLTTLRWRILFRQEWYWEGALKRIEDSRAALGDHPEAQAALARGRAALRAHDLDALRECVWELWDLMPGSARDREQTVAAEAWLRRA